MFSFSVSLFRFHLTAFSFIMLLRFHPWFQYGPWPSWFPQVMVSHFPTEQNLGGRRRDNQKFNNLIIRTRKRKRIVRLSKSRSQKKNIPVVYSPSSKLSSCHPHPIHPSLVICLQVPRLYLLPVPSYSNRKNKFRNTGVYPLMVRMVSVRMSVCPFLPTFAWPSMGGKLLPAKWVGRRTRYLRKPLRGILIFVGTVIRKIAPRNIQISRNGLSTDRLAPTSRLAVFIVGPCLIASFLRGYESFLCSFGFSFEACTN